MDIQGIREALHREPFEPFSIQLTDGRSLPVSHPDFVALGPRRIVVVTENDSWSVIEPLLIVSLDSNAAIPRVPKSRRPDLRLRSGLPQLSGPAHNAGEMGSDRSYFDGSSLNISTSSSWPFRRRDAVFNSASRLSKRRALQCSWVQEPSVERNKPEDFSRISLCTVTASLHSREGASKAKPGINHF